MDKHDWFEAEQELQKIISNRVKSGLVMIREMEKNNHPMKQGCISIIYNTQLS